MSWLQLEFPLGLRAADAVEDALAAIGALAVTLSDAGDDPVYEPPPGATPLWRATRVTALFPADADPEALVIAAGSALGGPLGPHRITPLADRDWEREWLRDFAPMRFGARLWIVPTAFEPPEPAAVNVVLDPGLAFGTGNHPTTALCLRWLDATPPVGLELVDYGCGSGVLAIAAALLGASKVHAVDLDPQALAATRENAARNGVADRVATWTPAELPVRTYDGLVANILAGPLVELAPRFASLIASGGRFALSGVLAEQSAEVAAAYAPFAAVDAPVVDGDWVRIDGVRR